MFIFRIYRMVENQILNGGNFKVAYPELIQRHVLENASSGEILSHASVDEPYPEITATLGKASAL